MLTAIDFDGRLVSSQDYVTLTWPFFCLKDKIILVGLFLIVASIFVPLVVVIVLGGAFVARGFVGLIGPFGCGDPTRLWWELLPAAAALTAELALIGWRISPFPSGRLKPKSHYHCAVVPGRARRIHFRAI
jgi:hypothetical protein